MGRVTMGSFPIFLFFMVNHHDSTTVPKERMPIVNIEVPNHQDFCLVLELTTWKLFSIYLNLHRKKIQKGCYTTKKTLKTCRWRCWKEWGYVTVLQRQVLYNDWKGLYFLPNSSKTAKRSQWLCLCCIPSSNSGLKHPLKMWETQTCSCFSVWLHVTFCLDTA